MVRSFPLRSIVAIAERSIWLPTAVVLTLPDECVKTTCLPSGANDGLPASTHLLGWRGVGQGGLSWCWPLPSGRTSQRAHGLLLWQRENTIQLPSGDHW